MENEKTQKNLILEEQKLLKEEEKIIGEEKKVLEEEKGRVKKLRRNIWVTNILAILVIAAAAGGILYWENHVKQSLIGEMRRTLKLR